jgi:hypothetical protein
MKKALLIFSIFSLIVSLALCVEAHSDRTGSNGGHTNHKTGEYHYHHGYPAHDHYDMDGDGDIDCPYDFKDKTNHKSNGSSNTPTSTNKSNESGKVNNSRSETWIMVGIAIALLGFWISPIFFNNKKRN